MRVCHALLGAMVALVAAACGSAGGPSAEELAATMVAETVSAASPTTVPSDTPEPTPTDIPTDTPTPQPTETSTPTTIPTPTATPGPLYLEDDFEVDSGIWRDCKQCEWSDGVLYMGPYPAANTFDAYYTVCEACGTPTFYRIAVDALYDKGPTDRGFGLLIKLTDEYLVDLEISTWQTAVVWKQDVRSRDWEALDGTITGLIKPGQATNRIEVVVRPSSNAGKADIFVNINGKNVYVIFGQPADPGEVGLVVGFHSIGVTFDNFEFEEIEA